MSRLKTCNAVLMITGTSVGTGILGLPIVTSRAGLIPTFLSFVIAWAFMLFAAHYILSVKMVLKGHYHLSGLIKQTLGKTGSYFASITILLLLYALLCTYMMAGSAWLQVILAPFVVLPTALITVLFLLLFAAVMCCGERFIYNVNNGLGLCLIVAFVITVGFSLSPHYVTYRTNCHFSEVLPSFPLLLTTFGFSIVVPTVTEYLDYNEKSIKCAMLVGSLLALVAYGLWEWVTLGHIPLNGPMSFQTLQQSGDNGTGVMMAFTASVNRTLVGFSGKIFAIFAAITSFLGVSLALIHFLSDGLKRPSQQTKRVLIPLLTFLPPLIITLVYPRAFVPVLSVAGLFVAILLGLFPTLMIWTLRHQPGYPITLLKNNKVMIGTGLFFILVIIQEVVLWCSSGVTV